MSERDEWLEVDGLGGFASGTTAGIRTRRYHALLLPAATPPTGRRVLVAGLDAILHTAGSAHALSSQRYAPDVIHPDGAARIAAYACDPWPRWRFQAGEAVVEHSIFVPRGLPVTVMRWQLVTPASHATLHVRPFLAGRDYHAMHHENGAFRMEPALDGQVLRWSPYEGVLPILALANGAYRHEPAWYRNFLYTAERDRGLDDTEDLAAPGVLEFDLARGAAVLIVGAGTNEVTARMGAQGPERLASELAERERVRRAALGGRLDLAADAYIVRRGEGSTIVAGYPWFTDWGRDTFIALRGLCLATRRVDIARGILLEWAAAVSEGMLPNRFPDAGDLPEFNAVDASLWFIVAAHEWLRADPSIDARDRTRVHDAIESILTGYSRGTRYGIRCDDDGLLACGVPGAQLTWMDARVGDHVITPRIGKPVEVQALWINALWIGTQVSKAWEQPYARAAAAFERFWDESAGTLFDVVDVDHVRGAVDARFRPNQIFAVGGLPLTLVDGARARQIVDAVEARLLTPAGLRSLAPGEEGYVGRYAGGVASRDGAYHQGTVWPWLLGPFVEAWVRVRGNTAAARREARARFLEPLLARFASTGPAHVAEVCDGDAPHDPGGCPFQAWSVGEALRLDRGVLAVRAPRPDTAGRRRHRTRTVRV